MFLQSYQMLHMHYIHQYALIVDFIWQIPEQTIRY